MVSIIDCTAKCIGSDREHRFECGIDTCNRYYRCYYCYVCDPIFECTSCTTSAGKEDGDTREHVSLLNILKATVVMGLFVGGYRMVVPLENVWRTLVPVMLGGMVYVVLVLKFDRKIYKELKGILMQIHD